MRAAALEGLATLGGPPSAVTAATACLLDDDERVRAASLRTLAALGLDAATIDTHPWIDGAGRRPEPRRPWGTRLPLRLAWAGPEVDHDRRCAACRPGDARTARRARNGPSAGRHDTDRPCDRARRRRSAAIRAAALATLAPARRGPGRGRRPARSSRSTTMSTWSGLRRLAAVGPRVHPGRLAGRSVERLEQGAGCGPDRAPRSRPGCARGRRSPGLSTGSTARPTSVDARTTLAPATPGSPSAGPAIDFLLAVLSRREARTVGLALRALVVLGVPEAGGVIRRCLHSDDAEIRAQAIEALDSIGDRELPRALVRLLEDEAVGSAGSRCRACPAVR